MFKVPSGAGAAGPAYQSSGAASASHAPFDRSDLTEATQARWIADHVDRLFGAEKRGAVERLLATICATEARPGRDYHLLCLESFRDLAALGKSRYAGHFTLAIGMVMHGMADGSRKEFLAYRLQIENTVLADRSLASAPRASMLDFVRRVAHFGLKLPDDMGSSYYFHDAELINRLAKALPDEIGLHARESLDMLAVEIDEVNAIPECIGQPHVAMGGKVMLLVDCFPDQRFGIHFRREMGLDNDDYFLSVTPQVDQGNPKAIAHEPVEIYSGTVSPGEEKQSLWLLILAIQLRVRNELYAHRAVIDSSASLIAKHRDAMTQDAATRWFLTERGDDALFHCENYRYVGFNAHSQTFSATFGDVVMVFSNVPPIMGELRGERLKKCLQHGRYRNLNELMATGHRTAEDPILRAVMSTLQDDVLPMMLALDEDGLRVLAKQIDCMRVADTTLGALWDPIPRAGAQDALADYAKFRFEPAAGSGAVGRAGAAAGSVAAAAARSAAESVAKAVAVASARVPAREAPHAGLHSPLRGDVFSAPLYGSRNVEDATRENPSPEGVP